MSSREEDVYEQVFIIFLFIPLLAVAVAARTAAPVVITFPRVLKTCLVLLSLFVLASLLSLLVGSSRIDALTTLRELVFGWRTGFAGLDETERTILFSIRLPRILFAGIIGAALSMAGVVFQALLRNPLAEPYILGISGGAAVGAIIGILLGVAATLLGISALAFLGGLASILIVFGIARSGREIASNTLLLAGVISNAFYSAVIMYLLSTSSSDHLHGILFWLMGDLSMAGGRDILLTGGLLAAGFAVIYAHARPLNMIVMGEETALQLGVPVERTKAILFITASLTTAGAVAASGTIGFVGLIIPHLMRMLLGSDHRLLVPASVLFGATFMVLADTVARIVVAPGELPVGVVTAMCGAPYFIYLLRRKVG
jgi:iron complex transport system permease protein